MAISPTQKSLQALEKEGYLCAVVEKWNPFVKIRQDLWGWCDILVVRKDEVLAVQTTSWDNVSSRINKIQDSETVGKVREAGIRIEVHGWKKNEKNRYVCKIVDIS